MKKLVFALAILFGSMFVSCSNKQSETTTDTVDSVEVVVDSVDTLSVDTLAVDTLVIDSIN